MLLSKVEPKGANYTTSYEYNALRSLTKVTDANNSSWNFQYDDVQNLTQKEDALNRITSYEYDNLDRLKKTTQSLSKITTYGYDNNSNVLTTTDPKNQTMTYTYDELDRVDTGIYRNELNAEKLFHDYKYDAEDNLYEVAERVDFTNNRTYTKTFDKRNRLKSSTDAYSKTVAFTYDSANNLKSLTDAGSKVTSYNYDSQNRLDTVAQNSSTIADYDWYSDGLLKQVKYSETSKRDYNYDNADRVSNITNTIGTGSESFDYGYDANSNRETETRNINGAVSKTIAYGYDQLNRLESASYTANSTTNQLTYTYDKVGNRKTENGTDQQGNAVNKTADYDDLDRLTKLTETNLVSDFEYDDNSNLTKVKLNNVDNETFEYDIRNQLSKYTSIGNGITADYDYDFERKRLSKTVSNVRRDYVYAGNQVINEYLADNLNASYGIGSGEIVKSDFVGEGSRNYFSDALGSITSLADTSSSLISRNDYDSFGEIASSTGLTQNAVTYTGQRLDVESGLMALGNGERYYNPSYGRFIQQDSYAGMPDMPQSLNRFAYTYNNPFSYTDPSGNQPQSQYEQDKQNVAGNFRDWAKEIDESDDSYWVKQAKRAGLVVGSVVIGGAGYVKNKVTEIPGMIAEPFYRTGDEFRNVYYEFDGTDYKNRSYNSSFYNSIKHEVVNNGQDPKWARFHAEKNSILSKATFGLEPMFENVFGNLMDLSEGKIDIWEFNLNQSGNLVEAGAMYVGARMGRGSGNPKVTTSNQAGLGSRISTLKTNVKTSTKNTLGSIKETSKLKESVAAVNPNKLAARSNKLNIPSTLRALRQNGSKEALATAKLLKRGIIDVKFVATDPLRKGAAGRYFMGTNRIRLAKDKISNPKQAAGYLAHETKHYLQKITPKTYRLRHEFEAYKWQRSADKTFPLKSNYEIEKFVRNHKIYKNVPE